MTETTVKLSDCKNVVKQLKPSGATLFVTGQVDEAQVRAAFAASLPNWKGKAQAKRMDKAAKPVTGSIFVSSARTSDSSRVRNSPVSTGTSLDAKTARPPFGSSERIDNLVPPPINAVST